MSLGTRRLTERPERPLARQTAANPLKVFARGRGVVQILSRFRSHPSRLFWNFFEHRVPPCGNTNESSSPPEWWVQIALSDPLGILHSSPHFHHIIAVDYENVTVNDKITINKQTIKEQTMGKNKNYQTNPIRCNLLHPIQIEGNNVLE